MKPGDTVRITGGFFGGYEGEVDRFEEDTVIVRVEIFGRKKEVEVSRSEAEVVDGGPGEDSSRRATDRHTERYEGALQEAKKRFLSIKPQFESTFGLLLPEQTARFRAFTNSLEGTALEGYLFLGLVPAGIMDWFKDDFDRRELREGLDHRLHFRFYLAPPEFVCTMVGRFDSLNYGLWYEDPAEAPAWVASFSKWDEPKVEPDGGTLLEPEGHTLMESYRMRLERTVEELEEGKYSDSDKSSERVRMLGGLRDAVRWFETGDRSERGSAYVDKYQPAFPKADRVNTLDGFGVASDRAVNLPDRPRRALDLYKVYREDPDRVRSWIDAARRELEEGNPYPALVVGRDLHYMSMEEFESETVALLVEAYEALGRHALAEIAQLQHRHRVRDSAGVYT